MSHQRCGSIVILRVCNKVEKLKSNIYEVYVWEGEGGLRLLVIPPKITVIIEGELPTLQFAKLTTHYWAYALWEIPGSLSMSSLERDEGKASSRSV